MLSCQYSLLHVGCRLISYNTVYLIYWGKIAWIQHNGNLPTFFRKYSQVMGYFFKLFWKTWLKVKRTGDTALFSVWYPRGIQHVQFSQILAWGMYWTGGSGQTATGNEVGRIKFDTFSILRYWIFSVLHNLKHYTNIKNLFI